MDARVRIALIEYLSFLWFAARFLMVVLCGVGAVALIVGGLSALGIPAWGAVAIFFGLFFFAFLPWVFVSASNDNGLLAKAINWVEGTKR